MNERIIKCKTADLNYSEGPNNGPDVLFIHGGCSRWQSLMPIMAELKDVMHIYAVDLRGHGKSHRAISYKLRDYAQDISLFLSECIQKPTIIFGNSLGGMVAVMTAAHYPELVKAVIVGDAPLSLNSLYQLIKSQQDMANRIMHWLKTNQKEFIYNEVKDDFLAESLSLCDPKMLNAMFNEFESTFADYVADKLFPAITCPISVIQGNPEKGSLISDADIKHIKTLSKNFFHVQLSTVGHVLIDDKNALINALKLFIECAG